MLLIVPKQNWCHFEALECIFHLNLKKNSLRQSADSQSTNTSFPNIWSTLYTRNPWPMFTRIEALFIGLFLDLATFLIASKSTRIVHLKLALALVQSNVAYFSPRKRRLSKEKEPLSQQHNNAKKSLRMKKVQFSAFQTNFFYKYFLMVFVLICLCLI